mgnify:CR=1 FL=1
MSMSNTRVSICAQRVRAPCAQAWSSSAVSGAAAFSRARGTIFDPNFALGVSTHETA